MKVFRDSYILSKEKKPNENLTHNSNNFFYINLLTSIQKQSNRNEIAFLAQGYKCRAPSKN